jgi:arsenical pump membrane protein
LPLVAGLFVLVEALEKTGATDALTTLLRQLVGHSAVPAAGVSGVVLAVGCNRSITCPQGCRRAASSRPGTCWNRSGPPF